MTDLLEQTADRLLTASCPPEVVSGAEDGWAPAVWAVLTETGLSAAGIPEAAGGSGGTVGDAGVLVRAAARHAAPVPLAETLLLAGWACSVASLPLPSGPLTAVAEPSPGALRARRAATGWQVSGTASRVAWARCATRIAAIAVTDEGAELLVLLDPARCVLSHGTNLAGEPRDDVDAAGQIVTHRDAAVVADGTARALWTRGALARVLQIAGALDGVLELTVRYAGERIQFGRPIARFQAVQQQVALLAGDVVATSTAAEAALAAVAHGGGRRAVAAAKVRASGSAGTVARLAHQVHGAIGFTREHRLHHLTRRLWSWREEFGSDEEWALDLGRELSSYGPEQLWTTVTDESGQIPWETRPDE